MKYNFASGIRPHTGKYHIYRGTAPQTDMNRLAAVIAVVLAITVAAFGFGLNRVPDAPNYPAASVSSRTPTQPGGQSSANSGGTPTGPSGDGGSNSDQPAASSNTSPAFRPIAQRQSGGSINVTSAPGTTTSGVPAASTETPSVGGRGGSETAEETDPPVDTGCGCINSVLDTITDTVTSTPTVLP